MVSPGGPQNHSRPWRDVTGSRGGRGRSSQGAGGLGTMAPPVAPRLPVIHRRAAVERVAGTAGILGGILPGRVLVCLGGEIARFFREERRKHGGRRAEDSTRTSRDVFVGHGEMVSSRMPHTGFGLVAFEGRSKRTPSAVLGEGSASAVLPAQSARCPSSRRAPDATRDRVRSEAPSPPPLPGSLLSPPSDSTKRSAAIRLIRQDPRQ